MSKFIDAETLKNRQGSLLHCIDCVSFKKCSPKLYSNRKACLKEGMIMFKREVTFTKEYYTIGPNINGCPLFDNNNKFNIHECY